MGDGTMAAWGRYYGGMGDGTTAAWGTGDGTTAAWGMVQYITVVAVAAFFGFSRMFSFFLLPSFFFLFASCHFRGLFLPFLPSVFSLWGKLWGPSRYASPSCFPFFPFALCSHAVLGDSITLS